MQDVAIQVIQLLLENEHPSEGVESQWLGQIEGGHLLEFDFGSDVGRIVGDADKSERSGCIPGHHRIKAVDIFGAVAITPFKTQNGLHWILIYCLINIGQRIILLANTSIRHEIVVFRFVSYFLYSPERTWSLDAVAQREVWAGQVSSYLMPIVEAKGRQVLFLHVPKTGGSSIEKHLESIGRMWLIGGSHRSQGLPCSPQHLHAAAIRQFFPELAPDWAFMVVRHPVERLISQYKYQTRKAQWLRKSWSFSVWLRYVLARRKFSPYYRDNHFRPQVEFEGFAAEVFHFEDGLDRCIVSVDNRLGIASEQELVWEKRSAGGKVEVCATDLDVIREVYQSDFKRYGYK